MKKQLIILFTIILSTNAALAFEFKNGPWVQNITETSFTVLWTTEQKTFTWIEVAPDDGTDWYQIPRERYYETVSGRRFYGTFHRVTVSGLEKGKKYRYRVVGKVVTDDSNPYALVYGPERKKGVHSVKTFDHSAETCAFSMVNDMHFKTAKYADLISKMDKDKTDFIVLNGDIVSFSNSLDTLLKYTFEPIKDFCGDYPVIFARGNHESRGAEWHQMPKAFPTPTGEFYFSFRQGPVAFLVLDAGEDKPDTDNEYSGQADYDEYRQKQLEWLKKEIENPVFKSAPHKVCLIHIPAFKGPDAWYTQKWVADNFTPVLNEAGVKLMLSGHHHKYILSNPGEHGNEFTIVANSNEERMDFSADQKHISINTYDRFGKLIHSVDL